MAIRKKIPIRITAAPIKQGLWYVSLGFVAVPLLIISGLLLMAMIWLFLNGTVNAKSLETIFVCLMLLAPLLAVWGAMMHKRTWPEYVLWIAAAALSLILLDNQTGLAVLWTGMALIAALGYSVVIKPTPTHHR